MTSRKFAALAVLVALIAFVAFKFTSRPIPSIHSEQNAASDTQNPQLAQPRTSSATGRPAVLGQSELDSRELRAWAERQKQEPGFIEFASWA